MTAPVSVVVPVFNGEATLPELVTRLKSALGDGIEILLVNDGSRDGSWNAIRKLAESTPQVRGINLMRNYGQHNALLAGIRAARHPVIVTLDDDLQNPPEEAPKLLAKLDEGFDVVYGTPEKQEHGLWRGLASTITKRVLQGAMGVEAARRVSAFRAFRTQAREAFTSYDGPHISIDVLLTWATSRFNYVVVRQDPRKAGVSNYTFFKLVTHAVNMLTGFTVVPLQMASLVGFFFTLFGVGVLGFVLFRYFREGGSVAGFPFLASVIAIFSGAQLFVLGIMGEYLARIHFRSMQRPTYVIREQTGAERP